jgi:DNA-binding NtrC family response regulator
VLVTGETGVGKEAVTRALHALSPRAKGPLVAFDCAAVQPGLLESALFGHKRGAFTGADRDHPGAITSADGGTLFLDEIGELPLSLQPKLLRLLESGEYRTLGEDKVRRAQARIVAATCRRLEDEVKAGRFRADLYYRLAVSVVEVPPLRARVEDIPLLAAQFAREQSGVEVRLAPTTLAALQCDPWPGNVRELRNTVQRVIILGESATSPRPPAEAAQPSYLEARDRLVDAFERDYLVALLQRNAGNVSAAAREAKLSRRQLYRLLERHALGGGEDEP